MEPSTTIPATGQRTINTLYVSGLCAEYTLVPAPARGWLALGAVRPEDGAEPRPAWLIVGTGDTPSAALQSMRDQLEAKARRPA